MENPSVQMFVPKTDKLDTQNFFLNIIKLNRNLIVFTFFAIGLEPNGWMFGSKSIGKW